MGIRFRKPSPGRILLLALCLVPCVLPGPVAAAGASGSAELEDILTGFEEGAEPGPLSNTVAETAGPGKRGIPLLSSRFSTKVTLDGVFALHDHRSVSTGTEYRGPTSLSSRLDLDLDLRFAERVRAVLSGHAFYDAIYALRGADDYPGEVLAVYRDELALDEASLSFSLPAGGNFRVGRQVVAAGKFDVLGAFRIFNPSDQRSPGLTAAENVHRPVCLSRLDYSRAGWRWTGLVVHEFRDNIYPAYGSDYYPFDFKLPPAESPANFGDGQSYGLLVGTLAGGWDINVMAASYVAERSLLGLGRDATERRIDRHDFVGLATDRAFNDWLIKFETAYSDNQRFYALEDGASARADVLAGAEYAGFAGTNLSFELLYRHFFDLEVGDAAFADVPYQDGLAWAFLARKRFQNDLLRCEVLVLNMGVDFSKGGMEKLSISYALSDKITVRGGVVFYREGEKYPFLNVGDNDRLFLAVELLL